MKSCSSYPREGEGEEMMTAQEKKLARRALAKKKVVQYKRLEKHYAPNMTHASSERYYAVVTLKEWTVKQQCYICDKLVMPKELAMQFGTCWPKKKTAHYACWKEMMEKVMFEADLFKENRQKFELVCAAERIAKGGEDDS
jgi:hypothetical protein